MKYHVWERDGDGVGIFEMVANLALLFTKFGLLDELDYVRLYYFLVKFFGLFVAGRRHGIVCRRDIVPDASAAV